MKMCAWDFERVYTLAVPVEYARVLAAESALNAAVRHNDTYLQQVDIKPLLAEVRSARHAWEAVDDCLVYTDDWGLL